MPLGPFMQCNNVVLPAVHVELYRIRNHGTGFKQRHRRVARVVFRVGVELLDVLAFPQRGEPRLRHSNLHVDVIEFLDII